MPIVTLLETDGDLGLFDANDIYRYDVDNRPLRNLLINDTRLRDDLWSLRQEVEAARNTPGLPSAAQPGSPFANLKGRLDAMEQSAGSSSSEVSYAQFRAAAESHAALYASGFTFPVSNVLNNLDLQKVNVPGTPNPTGPLSQDLIVRPSLGRSAYGQLFLRDENDTVGANRVMLGTGFEPERTGPNSSGDLDFLRYNPLELFVHGFRIQLFNEATSGPGGGKDNEVTWNLNAAPLTGQRTDLLWLEVWLEPLVGTTPGLYPYGAEGDLTGTPLTDPSDESLWGTVGFTPSGGLFQLRHRLRVTDGVDPTAHQFGMSDPAVLALGGDLSPPVAGPYDTFVNSVETPFRDPGLWVAGDGSPTSATEQNTVDGYVYGVPIALVFRRSSEAYDPNSAQNGTALTGPTDGDWNSGNSGRPDGLYHDKIESFDVVPLAPTSVSERTDLSRLLNESFDRLLRGRLHTSFGYLRYDFENAEDDGTLVPGTVEPVAGPQPISLNTISASTVAKSDQFIDATNTTFEPPDDFRALYGPQTEDVVVSFTLQLNGGLDGTGDAANFVTHTQSTQEIKLIPNGDTIGQSTARILNTSTPVLWWNVDKAPVDTGGWTYNPDGTVTAILTVPGGKESQLIVGHVKVRFTGSRRGFKKPNNQLVKQVYNPPAAAPEVPSFSLEYAGDQKFLGPSGVDHDATFVYVVDQKAHMLWKLNRTDYSVASSFGIYGTAGTAADNNKLNQPTDVAVDSGGNVFVADTGSHRIIKLDSSLAWTGTQFGDGTPAAADTPVGALQVNSGDDGRLNSPRGIAVDSFDDVYVSDFGLYRVVKIDGNLTTIDTNYFGVPGVRSIDDTHTSGPRNLWVDSGNKVYVADESRILCLTSTLTLDCIIQEGDGVPTSTGPGSQIVDPKPVRVIRRDSANNYYVLHRTGALSGKTISMISKFDASWTFLARFGGAWDDLGFGGNNAGLREGLGLVNSFEIDDRGPWTNLIAVDINNANNSVDMTQPVATAAVSASKPQTRLIVINASTMDLNTTLTNPIKTFNEGESAGIPVTPFGPFDDTLRAPLGNPLSGISGTAPSGDPQWPGVIPEWRPRHLKFDTTNNYCYVASSGQVNSGGEQFVWPRIEKWDMGVAEDPDNWTLIAYFGDISFASVGPDLRAFGYRVPGDETTRLNSVGLSQGMDLLSDGNALYACDNHTVIRFGTVGTALSYGGRYGTAGTSTSTLGFTLANATNPFSAYSSLTSVDLAEGPARVYVADTANSRITILKTDPPQWPSSPLSGSIPSVVPDPDLSSPLEAVGADTDTFWFSRGTDLYEFDTSSPNSPSSPAFVNPSAGVGADTIEIPIQGSDSALGFGGGKLFMGLGGVGNTVFVSDHTFSRLIALDTVTWRLLGEAGTRGVRAGDHGNLNFPSSISADADRFFVADYGNGRILTAAHQWAHVQPKTGRALFLVPPEIDSKWTGYSRYTAYQGVLRNGRPWGGKYPTLLGRAVILPPQKMLVTALGRGTVGNLSNPGVFDYGFEVQRLPIPTSGLTGLGIPPADFSLAGGILPPSTRFWLPILSQESLSFGYWPEQNSSYWADGTVVLQNDQTALGRTGYGVVPQFTDENGPIGRPRVPLGPVLSTFSCQTVPSQRVLAAPFLVVVDGEILMAVIVSQESNDVVENRIGAEIDNVVLELYRPVGHPLLLEEGDSDSLALSV